MKRAYHQQRLLQWACITTFILAATLSHGRPPSKDGRNSSNQRPAFTHTVRAQLDLPLCLLMISVMNLNHDWLHVLNWHVWFWPRLGRRQGMHALHDYWAIMALHEDARGAPIMNYDTCWDMSKYCMYCHCNFNEWMFHEWLIITNCLE